MFKLLEQTVFTSIGLASLTKDKINDLVAEVKQQAELTEQQAKEFEEEVKRRSEEARSDLTELVDKKIDHALMQIGLLDSQTRRAMEKAGDELRQLVDQRIDDALSRLGIARTEEIDFLAGRLDLLEKKTGNQLKQLQQMKNILSKHEEIGTTASDAASRAQPGKETSS